MKDARKLSILLKRINIALDNACNEKLKPLDMTYSQYKVMGYLLRKKEQELNQKDIETRFQLTNPTVTGILSRLEAKGFLIRMQDAADRRQNKIQLTEKGRALEGEVWSVTKDIENMLTKNMSDEEYSKAIHLFEKILISITEEQGKTYYSCED